jgi:hypothetical protein
MNLTTIAFAVIIASCTLTSHSSGAMVTNLSPPTAVAGNSARALKAPWAQTLWSCTCLLLDDETKKNKGKWGPSNMCAKSEAGALHDANTACESATASKKVNCKCTCSNSGQSCDW